MSYQFYHKEHLTEADLLDIYERIKADTILCKTLWYDGPPETPQMFLERLKTWWLARVVTADDIRAALHRSILRSLRTSGPGQ